MTLRRLGRSKLAATVALVAMVAVGVGLSETAEAYGRTHEREEALRQRATRMGVPVEMLRDPDQYLRDEARRAERRRERALAEMAERTAPNPVGLREHAALVREVRDRHQASRIGGLVQAIAAAGRASGRAKNDPVARARLDAAARLAGAGLGADLTGAPAALRQAVLAAAKATPGARLPSVSVRSRPRFGGRFDLQAQPVRLRANLLPERGRLHLPSSVMLRAHDAPRIARRSLLGLLLARLLPFPLVPTVPLFAVLDPPLPDDTAATVDAPPTPEIQALAASLGNDPRRIFYWVRSEIATEVYDGSKKGATGTLAERSGNDTDQASLLIALLRAAGVPCRYERTPVRLSVGQATGYTGTETAEAATTALATSGVVAQVIYEGGRAVGVDAVLTWVRAFVPYGSYRGATGSTGTAKWVSLVPALKRYRRQDIDAVDLRDAVTFDFSGYLSEERANSPVEVLSRDLLATARARNLPCTNISDMTKRRTIVREELSLLPDEPAAPRSPTLPGFTEITSDLDAGRRHGIEVRVRSSAGGTAILYETSMPAVYGHTVALRYEPATAEDADVLAAHGGIDGTAPWLYRLRPVLYVDDQSVGQGPADQPGREAEVEVVLTHPSRYRQARSAIHPVVVGGVYAFVFDAGGDLRAAREASRARLRALPDGTDARMAEKLQGWGLEWFSERHRAYDTIAGVAWNRLLLDVNEAMAALQPRVTTVAGAVVSLVRDRDVFDAGRLLVTPYAIDGDQRRSAFVTKLAGHTGSFLEHRVAQGQWSRNQWSAVRVVQRARQDGAVVLTIEPINEPQLDLVDASADLVEDMRARLRAGYTVTVPQLPIVDATLGELHAYLAVREDTGEGAYVIEGAIDGGFGETGEEEPGDSEDGDCESCPACCGQSDSSVNLANGNYTFTETDLTLPARGIPIVLTRTYSALGTRARSLGPGWSHSYERRLDEDVGTGDVLWTDAFGRARTFRAVGGGAYEPPAGFFQTLEVDADGFTLTSPDGMVERFAATGELQYQEDSNGNRVTLGYAGGRLQTVTDAAGRLVLSFTYTAAGRLETVQDLAGREVRYGYSPLAGDLAVVTDVIGNDWTFATDPEHRLVAKTDPDGGTVTIGYDDRGRAQTVVDRLGHAWQVSYDFANRRAVWTDRRGSTTVFEYDAQGAPVRVTDPLGNVTETEWNGRLNRLSDTDARGNRTTRTYDDQGNVLSTTDPLGRATTFEYGPLSRLVSTTDALDQTSTSEYDPAGNLLSSTDALGNVTTYEVDAFGQLSAIVRPGGARTEIVIDDGGNITSITDPEGGTTTIGYDAAGHMTSLTDANDHTRTMEVDDAGRLLSLTDPLTHRTSFEYDARGNRISATDPTGQTTFFRYDAQSRLVETEDAVGNVTRTEYDPEGAVLATADPRGARTRFALDGRGRTIAVTDPLGATTNIGYCAEMGGGSCGAGGCGASGDVCCVVDPLGNTTTRQYDELGRVVAETDPLGHTTQTAYDEVGRRQSTTDPKGRVTRFAYHGVGRLTSVEDAIGGITRYGYDARGNRTSVTDANDHVTSFDYDLANRLVRETTPIGTVTEYRYDLAGNRTSKLDGRGQTTTFAFDAARRLETITYDDGTTARFEYDSRGNRTLAENVDSHRESTYDALGRLETVLDQDTGRTIRYRFDETGNRTSMLVEPDGLETTYQWDLRGQLARMTDPHGRQYRFAHDAAGRRILTAHPNGIRRTDQYDDASRTTAIVYTSPRGDVLQSFAYEMDEAGNRTSKTFEDGNREQYGYDDLDRLVSATYPSGRAVQYEYDAVGNRDRMVDDGAERTYSYNAFNQLLDTTDPDGVTTFAWDDNGNQTARVAPDGTTEYTWDARDRLAEIALPDGTTAAYGYDTENLRVSMDDAGGARRILLDGLEEWGEVDEDAGDLMARFDHDPTRIDALLAQDDPQGEVAMLTDALGSVHGLADDAAGLRARYGYDAYGARSARLEEIATRWGFQGRTHPLSREWLYSRARIADLDSGIWLSPDPLAWQLALQAPPVYQFLRASPARFVDPHGLQGEELLALRIGAGVTAARLAPQGPSIVIFVLASLLTMAFLGGAAALGSTTAGQQLARDIGETLSSLGDLVLAAAGGIARSCLRGRWCYLARADLQVGEDGSLTTICSYHCIDLTTGILELFAFRLALKGLCDEFYSLPEGGNA